MTERARLAAFVSSGCHVTTCFQYPQSLVSGVGIPGDRFHLTPPQTTELRSVSPLVLRGLAALPDVEPNGSCVS